MGKIIQIEIPNDVPEETSRKLILEGYEQRNRKKNSFGCS